MKIITLLQGGLGNQLFQYAYGRALSLKYNAQLQLDLSFLTRNNVSRHGFTARPFELDKYNLLKTKTYIPIESYSIINDLSDTNNLQVNRNYYLEGYFHSENYFKDYFDVIKQELTLKNPPNVNILENSCSLHIRRGDYVNIQDYHPLQPVSYYKKAIEEIYGENTENVNFYIFSDDIDWCVNNLKLENANYITGGSNHDDLYMMSKCENNIIANSSFSWWAAYLNDNPNKKVVAPIKWFGESYLKTHGEQPQNLIPKTWKKI